MQREWAAILIGDLSRVRCCDRQHLPKHDVPADSNIVRFQERFRLAPEDGQPEDSEPLQFVFGDAELPVDSLPRRTLLERAVGDHLRAGGHWYIGRGWFPLTEFGPGAPMSS
jgi:hypothetical protein